MDARVSAEAVAARAILHPGVPDWMRDSLWEWLDPLLCRPMTFSNRYSSNTYRLLDLGLLRTLERTFRFSTGWQGDADYSGLNAAMARLRSILYANDELLLFVTDFVLANVDDAASKAPALERLLSEAGSAWRVGQVAGRIGLTERVASGTLAAAEQAFVSTGRAGQLLHDAWDLAFGMNRNSSASYRAAVRAVEAAACPVVIPSDPSPSLGKVIPALRDKPAKWSFTFTVDSAADPFATLVAMLQMLWTNEYSRHVAADESVPLHVSEAEAQSAAVLALTLVQWFYGGLVRPA